MKSYWLSDFFSYLLIINDVLKSPCKSISTLRLAHIAYSVCACLGTSDTLCCFNHSATPDLSLDKSNGVIHSYFAPTWHLTSKWFMSILTISLYAHCTINMHSKGTMCCSQCVKCSINTYCPIPFCNLFSDKYYLITFSFRAFHSVFPHIFSIYIFQ
jgi:hypothetical protein